MVPIPSLAMYTLIAMTDTPHLGTRDLTAEDESHVDRNTRGALPGSREQGLNMFRKDLSIFFYKFVLHVLFLEGHHETYTAQRYVLACSPPPIAI
jgi:hypothetical protein